MTDWYMEAIKPEGDPQGALENIECAVNDIALDESPEAILGYLADMMHEIAIIAASLDKNMTDIMLLDIAKCGEGWGNETTEIKDGPEYLNIYLFKLDPNGLETTLSTCDNVVDLEKLASQQYRGMDLKISRRELDGSYTDIEYGVWSGMYNKFVWNGV